MNIHKALSCWGLCRTQTVEEEAANQRRRSSQFAGRRSYLDLTQLQAPQDPQSVRRRSLDRCAPVWTGLGHQLCAGAAVCASCLDPTRLSERRGAVHAQVCSAPHDLAHDARSSAPAVLAVCVPDYGALLLPG